MTPSTWHRFQDGDTPDEGRVRAALVDGRSVALSRCGGRLGALENRCPHQGGPLGEGSIEKGLLRCPWHGYDYDPLTGVPPGEFADAVPAFAVQERDDGAWVLLPDLPEHVRTVGDVIVETLVAWGVTQVFGMVGHSNLGVAEAMRRAEERGEMRYIGIRHEGAAAFASGYAKLTGRPAACLAIAGPGSTNLLTGLYDAKVDGAPVIAISGQVPGRELGRGAFQDLDLNAAFGNVAISTATLLPDSDHGELVASAVKHAIDGRGVAHLVLPDEVQVQPSDAKAVGPGGRLADRHTPPSAQSIDVAAALLRAAARPVIVAGEGARAARVQLLSLAERLGAPVLTTFKAKGLVPDDHPLAAGVLGRSGTPVASWLMNESDLVLVVGASFSNHTGIATYKTLVSIDHTPATIGRFNPVNASVLADAGTALSALESAIGPNPAARDQREDVGARQGLWRAEKARRAQDDRGKGLAAALVFDVLSRLAPADAVFTVDVGNHAYSFGRYLESKGQPVLMSGYLGSIGFGYPAAIGAWTADPSRPVIAVTGDGGFGQYLAELTTAVKYGIPIKHVLLDNGSLGKIGKEQRAGLFPEWQVSLTNPNFAEYAVLCGAQGETVRTPAELEPAMTRMLAATGPFLLQVVQDGELV